MAALSGLLKRNRPDLRMAMGPIRRWVDSNGDTFAITKSQGALLCVRVPKPQNPCSFRSAHEMRCGIRLRSLVMQPQRASPPASPQASPSTVVRLFHYARGLVPRGSETAARGCGVCRARRRVGDHTARQQQRPPSGPVARRRRGRAGVVLRRGAVGVLPGRAADGAAAREGQGAAAPILCPIRCRGSAPLEWMRGELEREPLASGPAALLNHQTGLVVVAEKGMRSLLHRRYTAPSEAFGEGQTPDTMGRELNSDRDSLVPIAMLWVVCSVRSLKQSPLNALLSLSVSSLC